jgi:hypothetical protein
MSAQEIRPGQVYVACHPLDEGRLIRVVAVTGNRVTVETVSGGPARRRDMAATAPHASPTPRNGAPRRSGYALQDGDR